MKYIKKYEDNKYTLEDFSKIKYWFYSRSKHPDIMNLIFKINSIQYNINMYHTNENYYNITAFYVNTDKIENIKDVDNGSLLDLIIQNDKKEAVLRPATEEEIEKLEIKSTSHKYNI